MTPQFEFIAGTCRQTMGPFIPPLRTSSTYDDDEAFNRIALNLLSRFEALPMSAKDAIQSVLLSPASIASFLEGLNTRKARSSLMSPSTSCLIHRIDATFSADLHKLVEKNSSICPPRLHDTCHAPRRLRRFFSDSDCLPVFRARKVQNIDWRMAEAIEHVEALQLDEPPRVGYKPPSPLTRLG